MDWSKFLLPPTNLKQDRQEKMETVCGDGEDDEDGDDDDPSLPKVKKLLCSHSTDPFSSLDLLSSFNSTPSVDSQNCPASSNTIGHHLNMVADISQKHQETGKGKQRKESRNLERRQKHKQRKWPPWEDELGDEDSLEGMLGCKDCLDKSVHPQLAWDAFYRDENSLRDSFCIGRQCKWVVCAEEEEEDIEKVEDVMEKSKEAGEDLTNKSSVKGCPLLPADVPFSWVGDSSSLLHSARTPPSSFSAQAEP